MAQSTQFNGTLDREVCPVVVGFDFGTSCSKVVLRTPFHNNARAFATPFEAVGHKSCRYLLPSVLWITRDGRVSLAQIKGGFLLRDIKYHLMCGEPVPAVNSTADGARYDAKAVAAAFLALALRAARGWFLKEQKTLYGHLDLEWAFNIGLPSADFADKLLCSTYEKVAKAAWALSVSTGELHLRAATEMLDSPEKWEQLDDREAAEIQTIPEVAAEVAGYAKSSSRGDPEVHILADVGATTLDVCAFVLRKDDGDDCYDLYTADVRPLGASILYRARVSAVRKAVDDQLRLLWDEYDPVSAMAENVEAYAPKHASVSASIRLYDEKYTRDCAGMLGSTIVDLKTKRVPGSRRWQSTMPLFLSGGGSFMPFYREFIEQNSVWMQKNYVGSQGIEIRSLSKPDNLVANVDEQTYHRLAVAWGLSYPKTEIGHVTRPSDHDDVPPRGLYDWGGKEFVSKDMV